MKDILLILIIKLSKQKKNATFYVTDDNNSRIGSFYLKNGKFAKNYCKP